MESNEKICNHCGAPWKDHEEIIVGGWLPAPICEDGFPFLRREGSDKEE